MHPLLEIHYDDTWILTILLNLVKELIGTSKSIVEECTKVKAVCDSLMNSSRDRQIVSERETFEMKFENAFTLCFQNSPLKLNSYR